MAKKKKKKVIGENTKKQINLAAMQKELANMEADQKVNYSPKQSRLIKQIHKKIKNVA